MTHLSHARIKALVLLRLSALDGCIVLNTPTGVGYTADGKRCLRFGKKGLADILGCWHGRAFAVEVKAGLDVLSEDQEKFRSAWRRAGGAYLECRDPEMVAWDLRMLFDRLD